MTAYTVRDAKIEDAQRILEIYAYYVENTAITFEYDVPSKEEFKQRMRKTMQKYPYLVIEKEGRVYRYAYAGPFKERAAYDWACELSIYVDHAAKKCGLGKQLYAALTECLKQMGITNLYACIGYPQTEDEYLDKNSEQFHAHLGFQTVGTFHRCGYKFNRWYDMIWMEKMIGEHQSSSRRWHTGRHKKKDIAEKYRKNNEIGKAKNKPQSMYIPPINRQIQV